MRFLGAIVQRSELRFASWVTTTAMWNWHIDRAVRRCTTAKLSRSAQDILGIGTA